MNFLYGIFPNTPVYVYLLWQKELILSEKTKVQMYNFTFSIFKNGICDITSTGMFYVF